MGRKSRISESSQTQSSFRRTTRRKNEVSSLDDLNTNTTLLGDKERRGEGVNDEVSQGQGSGIRSFHFFSIMTRLSGSTSLIIGILIGLSYFAFISTHFQRLTNFSSLSNLEKELSLPTHTAFRYSFFKRAAIEDSLVDGMRTVIYDKRTDLEKNATSTNSFQKHALMPELILATGFHMIKRVWKPACGPLIQSSSWADTSCAGPNDPLTFYLHANWALDACFVVIIVITGTNLSGCTIGGVLSGLIFVLNHPQMGDWEELFPKGDKMGMYTASLFTFTLPQFLFKPLHPSWTTIGKLSLMTALLIILLPMESQWILISQLFVMLAFQFTNVMSPYLLAIVMGAHFAGWEYASLVTLDPSFRCWSFYFYLSLGALITAYFLRPFVDSLFGEKLDKWMFLRAIILGVGLYIFVSETRHWVQPLFKLEEDPRISKYVKCYDTTNKSGWSTQSHTGFGAVSATSTEMDEENGSLELDSMEEDNLWLIAAQGQEKSSVLGSPEKDSPSSFHTNSGESFLKLHSQGVEIVNEPKNENDLTNLTNAKVFQQNLNFNGESERLEKYLLHCLLLSENSPIQRLQLAIRHQLVPLVVAIMSILNFLNFLSEKRKFLLSGIFLDLEEEHGLHKTICYHVVSSFAFLGLGVIVPVQPHNGSNILLLAQLSLLGGSLIPFHAKDNPNCSEPFDYSLKSLKVAPHQKSISSAIAVLMIAIMIFFTKRNVNRMYDLPQKLADSGNLNELVEVTKWIREQGPQSRFLGPSSLMTNVYLSGEQCVLNHKENQLPYFNLSLSPLPLHLLFSKISLQQFHLELNTSLKNVTHLLISLDFCSNPSFPYSSNSNGYRRGSSGSDTINNDNFQESETPRNADERESKESRSAKEKEISFDIYKKSYTSNRSQSCDLTLFWDNIFSESNTGATEGDMSLKKETLCQILLASGTHFEIEPFQRVFHNRLYSVITWNMIVN